MSQLAPGMFCAHFNIVTLSPAPGPRGQVSRLEALSKFYISSSTVTVLIRFEQKNNILKSCKNIQFILTCPALRSSANTIQINYLEINVDEHS